MIGLGIKCCKLNKIEFLTTQKTIFYIANIVWVKYFPYNMKDVQKTKNIFAILWHTLAKFDAFFLSCEMSSDVNLNEFTIDPAIYDYGDESADYDQNQDFVDEEVKLYILNKD